MRRFALVITVVAACGGSGAGDDILDGEWFDAAPRDGAAIDAPTGGDGSMTDASNGGGGRILFQCDGTGGGICTMDADGDNRQTVYASGFVPHGLADGAILFHTSAYRVTRRTSAGNIQDLGDGAFPRLHPDGRILFQCAGLNGGLCVMNADGSNRNTLRATGRVPDIDAAGVVILFHSDDYHVWRRDSSTSETDLGLGAFPTWAPDGRILFQCTGLGGGLCRMNADGSNRETIAATGRVPDLDSQGRIVFHSDSYVVNVRSGASTSPLSAGANAVWW